MTFLEAYLAEYERAWKLECHYQDLLESIEWDVNHPKYAEYHINLCFYMNEAARLGEYAE